MSVHNEELNSLFIHVPKAAGSSLSSVSWNRGSGHDTIEEYEARGILTDDLFVWAFVRNPFERIASAYEDCPELFDEFPTFDHFIVRIWNNRKKLERIRSVRWRPGGIPDLGLNVSRIHFLPQNFLLRTKQGVIRLKTFRMISTKSRIFWGSIAKSFRTRTNERGKVVVDVPTLRNFTKRNRPG